MKVIVIRHRWGDSVRFFSSVVRTRCILSVGVADSIEKVLSSAAAAVPTTMAAFSVGEGDETHIFDEVEANLR